MPLEEFYIERPGGGRLLCGRSRGPADGGGGGCFIILPGFWGDWRREAFAALAAELDRHGTVFAANMSGHPGSSGAFTFGIREAGDVAALYTEVRKRFSGKVTALGFSLGGWSLARHLASCEDDRKATVHLVMACVPSKLPWLAPRPWKKGLLIQLERGGKGLVAPAPLSLLRPRELGREVAALGDLPTSFIHCSDDWLVHHSHSESLYASAEDPKRLIVIDDPRGLHAEMLALFHLRELISAVLEIPS